MTDTATIPAEPKCVLDLVTATTQEVLQIRQSQSVADATARLTALGCTPEEVEALNAVLGSGAGSQAAQTGVAAAVGLALLRTILTNTVQAKFEVVARLAWKVQRDQARVVFKAYRTWLDQQGQWPKTASNLQQQVVKVDEAKTAKADDPAAGQAAQQRGIMGGVKSGGSLLVIAQRTARELAANGPITMDDVTFSMSGAGHKVDAQRGGAGNNWKGSVFGGSEWVCVGTAPSRIATAHGRRIKLWALKTWLDRNTLNGQQLDGSAFALSKIVRDFHIAYPSLELKRCKWYIGAEVLSADVRKLIVDAQNKLFDIQVEFMPGGIGAVLMGPDYMRAEAASKGQAVPTPA